MTERRDLLLPAPTSGSTARVAAVLVLSVVLGGLTSYAQGLLPDAALPFANSASGWTLLTVLLVFWSRSSAPRAAVLGAASFVLLVLGYTFAAELRGLTYDPLLFSVVGVVVGPFVGVAASWLRAREARAALGTSLLSGVATGEAVYGLTVVGDTTHPAYWVVIGAVGLALLGTVLARRIRTARHVALAIVGTALVAAAFVAAYSGLGRAAAVV